MYFPLFLILLIHGSNASGVEIGFELRIQHHSARLCKDLFEFMARVFGAIGGDHGIVEYQKYRLDGTLWRVEFGVTWIEEDGTSVMAFYPEMVCPDPILYWPFPLYKAPYNLQAFHGRFTEMCQHLNPADRLRIVSDVHSDDPQREQIVGWHGTDLLHRLVLRYRDSGHIMFENKTSASGICT